MNKYRNRTDVDTVEFDSEMAALANYRAYMDCTEGWDAHDGLEHVLDTGEFYDYMAVFGMDTYNGNKAFMMYFGIM